GRQRVYIEVAAMNVDVVPAGRLRHLAITAAHQEVSLPELGDTKGGGVHAPDPRPEAQPSKLPAGGLQVGQILAMSRRAHAWHVLHHDQSRPEFPGRPHHLLPEQVPPVVGEPIARAGPFGPKSHMRETLTGRSTEQDVHALSTDHLPE